MEILIRPVTDSDDEYKKRIASKTPIPGTKTGWQMILECGHVVQTFGRLEHLGPGEPRVFCDECRKIISRRVFDGRLRAGDYVQIRKKDSTFHWAIGFIKLAAGENDPQSCFVELFEGSVVEASGGLMGQGVAILIDYATGVITGLEGSEYEIQIANA